MSRLFYFTGSYFHKIILKEMYIIPLLFLGDEGVQRPYIALSLYSALILSRISDPIYILLLPHMRTCIPESTEEHKREAAPHGQIDIDITVYTAHFTFPTVNDIERQCVMWEHFQRVHYAYRHLDKIDRHKR